MFSYAGKGAWCLKTSSFSRWSWWKMAPNKKLHWEPVLGGWCYTTGLFLAAWKVDSASYKNNIHLGPIQSPQLHTTKEIPNLVFLVHSWQCTLKPRSWAIHRRKKLIIFPTPTPPQKKKHTDAKRWWFFYQRVGWFTTLNGIHVSITPKKPTIFSVPKPTQGYSTQWIPSSMMVITVYHPGTGLKSSPGGLPFAWRNDSGDSDSPGYRNEDP